MPQLPTLLSKLIPPKNGDNGHTAPARKSSPPFPDAKQVGPTEELVDVLALIGEALVLNNGLFVRMIEVAPVDLERVDASVRKHYWAMFARALGRLSAPIGIQIFVSTRPQNWQPYLERWQDAAQRWQSLAETSPDLATRDRRLRMARGTIETTAFLSALHEQLRPLQHRYLVVIWHNPFLETLTTKRPAQVLEDKLAGEALEKLDEKVQTVRAALGDLGLPMFDLDPAAMCQALWEFYHHPASVLGGAGAPKFDLQNHVRRSASDALDQCPSADEFLAAARDPERLADLLAPALVEELEQSVRVGEVVARGYLIYDLKNSAPVDFASLLAFPADTTHALYLWPAEPASHQQIKEKETELAAGQISDAQRGLLRDYRREADLQSLAQARSEMEVTLQPPYFLLWYALVWVNDSETLEKKCQKFESELKLRGIRYHPATRRQVGVLQAARPLARPVHQLEPRNMTAEALGSFFPFVRAEHFNPAGVHFGVHRGSGLLICQDAFEGGRSNASELVIAAPRTGKSVYFKSRIETDLLLGHRLFVFDPEREYLRLCIDYHGTYIELGKRYSPRPVPFDPRQKDAFLAGLVALGELYESLAARPLTDPQVGILAQAYSSVMTTAGILPDQPETWERPVPLLKEVVALLQGEPESTDARELGRVLAYTEALDGGHTLNIMDINLNSENPWQASAESLAAFVEALKGEPLDSYGFNALINAYRATMEKWGFKADDPSTWNKQAPTLSALVDTLSMAGDPHSRDLAAALEQYAHGLYADLFNRPTNVDIGKAQFICFGMRSLRENVERSLAPVFAWLALRLVWNAVVDAGASQPTDLYGDESWYLLEQPSLATRLERMARSLPKYHAALHLATHDIEELVKSSHAKVIAKIGRIKVLFGHKSLEAVQATAQLFGLSEAEKNELLYLGKGEGLLLLDTDLHLPVVNIVNPLRLPILATNIEQQQAVARASGRRAQPVL